MATSAVFALGFAGTGPPGALAIVVRFAAVAAGTEADEVGGIGWEFAAEFVAGVGDALADVLVEVAVGVAAVVFVLGEGAELPEPIGGFAAAVVTGEAGFVAGVAALALSTG